MKINSSQVNSQERFFYYKTKLRKTGISNRAVLASLGNKVLINPGLLNIIFWKIDRYNSLFNLSDSKISFLKKRYIINVYEIWISFDNLEIPDLLCVFQKVTIKIKMEDFWWFQPFVLKKSIFQSIRLQ